MEIKIYELRNPLNHTSEFSFEPIPASGGVSVDDGPVTCDPESIVHLVTVPAGTERLKSEVGEDRLQLGDGRLYSANAVMWYASNQLCGFSLVNGPNE